jgi:hypothetical protein
MFGPNEITILALHTIRQWVEPLFYAIAIYYMYKKLKKK